MKTALAIHGGAGTIDRAKMTGELEAEYRRGLDEALRAGWQVLEKNGDAVTAVEASVCSLEDFLLFNAGRGAVFTSEGKVELDAAIMDGNGPRAGAIAFVRNIRNPVKLARLVMDRSEHILLAGDGANAFAAQEGAESADDEYFFTDQRWQQLQDAIATGRVQLDHAAAVQKPLGTVGAVACDSNGNVAAATSTGGMTNKKFGRIGDTPLIGAGTYADNATCAVSCTGHGEFFMLGVTAYDVAARMKYSGQKLEAAAQSAIDFLTSIGGEGGLIAVDARGDLALPFNSEGMYRGHMRSGSEIVIDIYR
jgi:beta-aspartyl-peptidase (threonine type)